MLNNSGFSEKGGAGLGLVEMARKSGQKLEYDFEQVDENFSYFYLQIKLSPKTGVDIPAEKHEILISSAKDFNHLMTQNNILLAYKGDFSQNTIIPLLKIIERNLQVNPLEKASVKKGIYQILTELLQNVSKHAKIIEGKRDGIFLIGKDITKYAISTGNFIANSKIDLFKQNVDMLNSMDIQELNALYLKKLREGNVSDDGSASLGLIDIAKESNNKLGCDFLKINDETSFVTINVNY